MSGFGCERGEVGRSSDRRGEKRAGNEGRETTAKSARRDPSQVRKSRPINCSHPFELDRTRDGEGNPVDGEPRAGPGAPLRRRVERYGAFFALLRFLGVGGWKRHGAGRLVHSPAFSTEDSAARLSSSQRLIMGVLHGPGSEVKFFAARTLRPRSLWEQRASMAL